MNRKIIFFLFMNLLFVNFTQYYNNLSQTDKINILNYITYYPEEFKIINYII